LGTYTSNLNLYKPTLAEVGWSDEVNASTDILAARIPELGLNVKAAPFNAVGDGVADDTAEIQAAIDACVTAGGGTVLFPTGIYVASSTLTINSDHVTLLGTNKVSSRILFGNAVNPGLDLGDGVSLRHYIVLENLSLHRSTAGAGPIIRARKIDQCVFLNCQVSGGTNTVDIEEAISCSIAFCGISASTLIGMQIGNSDQMQIIGNYFEDQDGSTSPHLDLVSGNKKFSIVGNNFSTGGKALQVGVGPNTEMAIVGNTVENCEHGFDLDNGGVGLTRSTVAGNALRGTGVAGGLGIIVSSANTDLAITGNLVTNYAGGLLFGTPGASVEIIGNPGIPNRRQRADVVATASLPAAAAAEDGRILIEDGGAGDRNLIIYAGGQRFRIDGGANV
jgi:hypothetical protein